MWPLNILSAIGDALLSFAQDVGDALLYDREPAVIVWSGSLLALILAIAFISS
jgi:hypothetical protein